jgi:hypothetical protein
VIVEIDVVLDRVAQLAVAVETAVWASPDFPDTSFGMMVQEVSDAASIIQSGVQAGGGETGS